MQTVSLSVQSPNHPTALEPSPEAGRAGGIIESGQPSTFALLLAKQFGGVDEAVSASAKGMAGAAPGTDRGLLRKTAQRPGESKTAALKMLKAPGKKGLDSEAVNARLTGETQVAGRPETSETTPLNNLSETAGSQAPAARETKQAAKSDSVTARAEDLRGFRKKAEQADGGSVPGAQAGLIQSAAELSERKVPPAAPTENPEPKIPGTRNASKRDKREARVTVVDMRMRPEAAEPGKSGENHTSENAGAIRERVGTEGGASDWKGPSAQAEAGSRDAGGSFTEILSRHLEGQGAQDIVKATHIALRDGDSGMIRLRLEPDSLGSVKIELKMAEKNITGRIVVETEEARSAFEKSLAGLRDAFSAGGFETASLEVSVSGGQSEGRGNSGNDTAGPFFSDRLRELDAAVPLAAAAVRAEHGVDMFA